MYNYDLLESLKTWEVVFPRHYYKCELGYFFVDECEQLYGNGPYATLEDCALAMEQYVLYYL
jgi:hypothetical protein